MADEIGKLFREGKIKTAIQKLGTPTANKAIEQLAEIGPEACNSLFTALKDKNYKVRQNAAKALGAIKDKKSVEPLLRLLTDEENPEVQDGAVEGLVSIGYPALKTIIKILEDDDDLEEERKKRIVRVLDNSELSILTKGNQAAYHLAKGNFAECAKLGAAAVPHLINALNKGDENLREKAETTLVRIGMDATAGLINTIHTQNEKLREVVIQVLDKIDINLFHPSERAAYYLVKGELDKCSALATSATYPVIKALEDPRKEVVNNAISVIKKLGSLAVDELIKELKGRKRKTKALIAKLLGELKDKKAVEVLISCLSDMEAEVRINAAQALCDIGDEKSIPFLINKALLDKDKKVRVLTGEGMKKMGLIVAPPLIKILEDPKGSEELKEISVKVLGEIKAENAIKILTNLMIEGKGKLKELSAKSLGDIGSKKATDSLIKVLDDAKELSGWSRGFNAAVSLGKIGDPKAVEPLVKILHDENYLPQLQGAAAEALGKIGDKKVIEELIKALSNKKIQREVISAIGKLGNIKGVEPLLKLLNSDESSTPLKALIIEALGNLGDYSSTDDIIKLLKKEHLKLPGVIALGKIREERAIPDIEEMLFDRNSDEKLKKSCIETLIKIRKKQSIASMIKVIKSKEVDVNSKKLLVESFPEMGEIIIKPFIEELQNEHTNLEFHKYLIEILGKLKSTKVVPDLLALLGKTAEETIKGKIIIALGSLGDISATDKLIAELENPDNTDYIRKTLIISLINIGDKKSIENLIKMLDKSNKDVREYCLAVFKKIGVPIVNEEGLRKK